MSASKRFNPPPGWPPMPQGWTPPPDWQPPPQWPSPPPGWPLWVQPKRTAPWIIGGVVALVVVLVLAVGVPLAIHAAKKKPEPTDEIYAQQILQQEGGYSEVYDVVGRDDCYIVQEAIDGGSSLQGALAEAAIAVHEMSGGPEIISPDNLLGMRYLVNQWCPSLVADNS